MSRNKEISPWNRFPKPETQNFEEARERRSEEGVRPRETEAKLFLCLFGHTKWVGPGSFPLRFVTQARHVNWLDHSTPPWR